jgi:hypothetical protein
MAFNVTCVERSMYPEAVEAGFLDDCDIKRPSDEMLGSPVQACQQVSNFGASPAAIVCFDILSLFGDSEVTSQVDRLNSSDTYRVE